jgi:thymidylate synthase
MKTNADIRQEFVDLYQAEKFVIDKTGVKVVEIINASFCVNEDRIFGEPNQDYIARELAWYESQSLNVNDIPPPVPVIWKKCATPEGFINSNYGWMIYSKENGSQYDNVLKTLLKDPFSRRAEMIYTRPSMHVDYNAGGRSDFVCTEAVQYLIRDNKLHSIVKMRSGDAIFGFLNDYSYQLHVSKKLLADLSAAGSSYELGPVHWNTGSFHIYERHFFLIEHFIKTGELISQNKPTTKGETK